MRALVDYVIGFLLVVFSMVLFTGGANAIGLALAVVALVIGVLMIAGRAIGGRNVDRQD